MRVNGRFGADLAGRAVRARELSDIVDEAASLLDALGEAMGDFDADLAADCLREMLAAFPGLAEEAEGIIAGADGPGYGAAAVPEPAWGALEPGDPCTGDGIDRVVDALAVCDELVGGIGERADWLDDALDIDSPPGAATKVFRLVAGEAGRIHAVWHAEVVLARAREARVLRGTRPPSFLAERRRRAELVRRLAARGNG